MNAILCIESICADLLNSHPNAYNIFKDVALPILIAGVAAFVAYRIFIIESRNERQNELQRVLRIRNDKLLYFASLIRSVLNTAKKQIRNYEALITNIKTDPIEFHLLLQVPLYNIKRIVVDVNHEEYLLAYVGEFSSELRPTRVLAVDKFRQISDLTDFLYETFNQGIDMHVKKLTFDNDRKKQYADHYTEAHKIILELTPFFSDLNNNFSTTFFEICRNIENQPHDNNQLTNANDFFFKPFNEFCRYYFASEQIPLPSLNELAYTTYRALQLFNEIASQNEAHANDLKETLEDVAAAVEKLENASEDLLSVLQA